MGNQRGTLGDFQKRMCGLTEPLLRIQLVAEGSLSKWRALGVAITRARRVNVEGSAFQLNQRNGSVKTKKNCSAIKGDAEYIRSFFRSYPKRRKEKVQKAIRKNEIEKVEEIIA